MKEKLEALLKEGSAKIAAAASESESVGRVADAPHLDDLVPELKRIFANANAANVAHPMNHTISFFILHSVIFWGPPQC